MKKIFTIIIAIALAFVLAGCNQMERDAKKVAGLSYRIQKNEVTEDEVMTILETIDKMYGKYDPNTEEGKQFGEMVMREYEKLEASSARDNNGMTTHKGANGGTYKTNLPGMQDDTEMAPAPATDAKTEAIRRAKVFVTAFIKGDRTNTLCYCRENFYEEISPNEAKLRSDLGSFSSSRASYEASYNRAGDVINVYAHDKQINTTAWIQFLDEWGDGDWRICGFECYQNWE